MEDNKYELEIIQQRQLAELQERKVIDDLLSLKTRLNRYKDQLVGGGPNDHRWVIAYNHAVGRVNSQTLEVSITGMESIADTVRDYSILANNGILTGSMRKDLGTHSTVYVVVESQTVGTDITVKSNRERIEEAVEDFELFGDPYTLMLYFNTSEYAVYKELLKEVADIRGTNYEAVNVVDEPEIPEDALIIDFIPPIACEDLVNNFLTSMSIPPAAMRSPVFLHEDLEVAGVGLSVIDISLIASRSLSKLRMKHGRAALMAREATSMWLDHKEYKFVDEHIHDFFNSPSIVHIRGVSYFYGIITKREMKIQAVELGSSGNSLKSFELNNVTYQAVKPVDDPVVLHEMLMRDSKNTRDKLFMFNDSVYRLVDINRKLHFHGRTSNYTRSSLDYVIENDFSKVTLLNNYFMPAFYRNILKIADSGYRLPDKFNEYIIRKASLAGAHVNGQEWFRSVNSRIGSVIDALDRFDREAVLRKYISPVHGFLTTEIELDWGDLK